MTQKTWRTAIASHDKESIHIAGYRVSDMMRHLDFGAALFVLYQQRVPSAAEAKLANALLVSVIDHGIVVPSVIARMVAASGVPIQACAAAGILTIGDVHGGAGEQVGRRLAEDVARAKAEGTPAREYARRMVAEARRRKERIEGYGHPLHPVSDERVETIVEMARELGVFGAHLELAVAVADEIHAQSGKRIPLNIDGAMAGALLDLGFDWRLARVFVFVPRAAGISAHAVEEVTRERGWRIAARDEEIDYDGPPPRPLQPPR